MSQAPDGPAERHPHAAVASLSPRQAEIAALVAAGLTNREIADRLVLPGGTVGNHLEHILRRTVARNRVQLGVWLAEWRLCEGCRDAE